MSVKKITLECSVPASAKINIRGTAKTPNRENNVSAEISCFTVIEIHGDTVGKKQISTSSI